ncbi:hypothetical protein [Erythrobacter sp. SG61-1L]|uniref:hypothetical protein n=1 Tax=Erythrobacter sp. SG61-1L TaxID=1603897 RepID=UPI0006C8FF7E|nr:hypothetical protein [Erythrobacter sp. SG61-1L]
MLHKFFEPGDWFAPKKYGYGAGMPIAWQGWVVLAAYLLVVFGAALAMPVHDPNGILATSGVILFATAILLFIARKRTRGGWKWRSGKDDDDAPKGGSRGGRQRPKGQR